jgi:hypothetical protein
MEIRNTSPLGDLDVTLLGRVVMAGEVIDVTEEQAVELCSALANFAPVDPDALPSAPDEPEPRAEGIDMAVGGHVPADELAQATLAPPGVGPDLLIPGGADEAPVDEAVPDESGTKTKTRRASTDDTKEA